MFPHSVCFQLQQFKEDNLHIGFGSGTLALEQAIEKTMANIKWVAENKEQVLKWLTDETAWGMFISVNTDWPISSLELSWQTNLTTGQSRCDYLKLLLAVNTRVGTLPLQNRTQGIANIRFTSLIHLGFFLSCFIFVCVFLHQCGCVWVLECCKWAETIRLKK